MKKTWGTDDIVGAFGTACLQEPPPMPRRKVSNIESKLASIVETKKEFVELSGNSLKEFDER